MSEDTSRRRYLTRVGTASVIGLAGCMGGGEENENNKNAQTEDQANDQSNKANNQDNVTTWSLASNPSDSPPFTWGAILSKLCSQQSDQLRLQPQSTTGFLDNFTRVSGGENDSGLSSATAYWTAKEGRPPFEEPLDRLALGISPVIHKSGIYLAARPDAGIETLDDLAGKRFSFLHRGSATNPLNQAILEEAGVLSKTETVYQGFSDTRSAVTEGRIDAWQMLLFDGYYYAGPEMDMVESMGGEVVHIPIPEDVRNAVMKRFNKGWTYNEVDPSMTDLTVRGDRIDYFFTPSQLYVEPDKSDDLVYHLTKLMVENQDWLSEQNNVFKTYGWGKAGGEVPVEKRFGFEGLNREMFHPGAIQYYEEETDHKIPE